MRKLYFLLFLTLIAVSPAFGQNRHAHGKKGMSTEIKEFKMKFLAQELELKDDQQARFFDLYSKMMDERHSVFEDMISAEKKLKDSKDVSEEEYAAMTEKINASREKDLEIEKKYDKEFSSFLSQKQIFQLKNAEEKFRKKMHEMRAKKKQKK